MKLNTGNTYDIIEAFIIFSNIAVFFVILIFVANQLEDAKYTNNWVDFFAVMGGVFIWHLYGKLLKYCLPNHFSENSSKIS